MTDAPPVLIRDRRFREHAGPAGHPERPARLDAIDEALAPLADQITVLEPRLATDEEILRVHERAHLDALIALEGRAAQLDPDTYASARSLEVARLAAGSTVELALRAARGELRSSFALVRPPGHHAERQGAMGFCLLNQIAMAAEALRAQGMERVAVVDFDVHHGNGTQHAFENERDVLFLSLHQFPFYPGTGALAERGNGPGFGSTVNLPLPAGCGDAEYAAVFDRLVVPVLREFQPEILLVSAGFDAHERDPLASMQVTTAGFARMASRLLEVANECCDGRIVFSLEGGYDLQALGDAVATVTRTLLAGGSQVGPAPTGSPSSEALVGLFREAHGGNFASVRPATSA
jgi:acetoin utilization deacetylase AcuC-like enzyme